MKKLSKNELKKLVREATTVESLVTKLDPEIRTVYVAVDEALTDFAMVAKEKNSPMAKYAAWFSGTWRKLYDKTYGAHAEKEAEKGTFSEQPVPGSRPWGGFSDRWRGGSGFDSDTKETPSHNEPRKDEEGYGGQTTFFEGVSEVLSGLVKMQDGLSVLDNSKVSSAISSLLAKIEDQIESIKDAYSRLIEEQKQ